MKIFKTNLAELISEIPSPGPLYVSNFSQTRHGEMPMTTYQVTVAGWNAEGRVCELVISSRAIWTYDVENSKSASEQAFESEREIKQRLLELNYRLRDGRVSIEPVLGKID